MEARTPLSEPMSPSSPIAETAEGACFICGADYQLREDSCRVVCAHCSRTICASHRVTRCIESSKATICLKCYQRTYKSACPLRDRKEELRDNRRAERRLARALLEQKEVLERYQSRRISGRLSRSPEVCAVRINQEKERRGKIDLRIIELKGLLETQKETNEGLSQQCTDKGRETGQYREQEILTLKREIARIRAEIRNDLGTFRQYMPLNRLSELLCPACLRRFPHSPALKPAPSPRQWTPPPTPSTVATPTTQSCASCHLI